jgi:methylated-DNA-[protein]-cysteine S-methyltransferase
MRAAAAGLRGIDSERSGRAPRIERHWQAAERPFRDVARQLGEYFAGRRRRFDLELAPEGTRWEIEVWRKLVEVPYGETVSYAELARRLGRPEAFRAVGAANGKNPISIVIPCHRVIGSDGSLTGYGSGLEVKAALLDLERGERLPTRSSRTQASRRP